MILKEKRPEGAPHPNPLPFLSGERGLKESDLPPPLMGGDKGEGVLMTANAEP